jgi:hypothetical membrane protein
MFKNDKTAGLLFFSGGSFILLGILTAEIFYPGSYSISLDMISTLGASSPPDSVIKEPSAKIFDYSMMISGVLIIAGVVLGKLREKSLVLMMILLGAGALGVGIFPAFHSVLHPVAALTTFLSGGVAALLSSRVSKPPFSFIEITLGIIILVFLTVGISAPDFIVPYLGKGGLERWVAYPLIIWILGFGSYLMAREK